MQEKDVEVLLEGDILTIRGERNSETEDKARHFSALQRYLLRVLPGLDYWRRVAPRC